LPAVVLGLLVVRALWVFALGDSPAPLAEGEHVVQRVVDGGTLVVNSDQTIRLQGIDTPQPAAAAKALAERFIEQAGGVVRLTLLDERIDEEGNYLAFAWSGDRCLNLELVREGLARARLDYRHSGAMRTRLRDAQEEAREAGVGVWSK
jgi:micrococcal nuclease